MYHLSSALEGAVAHSNYGYPGSDSGSGFVSGFLRAAEMLEGTDPADLGNWMMSALRRMMVDPNLSDERDDGDLLNSQTVSRISQY